MKAVGSYEQRAVENAGSRGIYLQGLLCAYADPSTLRYPISRENKFGHTVLEGCFLTYLVNFSLLTMEKI